MQYKIVVMVNTIEMSSTVVSYFDLILSKAGANAFKQHPYTISKFS